MEDGLSVEFNTAVVLCCAVAVAVVTDLKEIVREKRKLCGYMRDPLGNSRYILATLVFLALSVRSHGIYPFLLELYLIKL